ncbi:MAG: divergent polysaccharide deacetylase family protein [Pseudoruegeria sp.]
MLRGMLGGLFWGGLIGCIGLGTFLVMSDTRLLSEPVVTAGIEAQPEGTAPIEEAPIVAAEVSETITESPQTPENVAPLAFETAALSPDATQSTTAPAAGSTEGELSTPELAVDGTDVSKPARVEDVVTTREGPIPSVPKVDSPLDVQQPADRPEIIEAPVVVEIVNVSPEAEIGEDILVEAPNVVVSTDGLTSPTLTSPQEAPELSVPEQTTDTLIQPQVPDQPTAPKLVLPQITDGAPLAPEEDVAVVDTAPQRAPVSSIADQAPTVRTDRLPRIGVAAEEPVVVEVPTEVVDINSLPALEAFSVPFVGDEALPKYSVVLIDDGSGSLNPEAFADFAIPLAIAIDASAPYAASAAYDYRLAGFEVVLLTRLPAGATPGDLEVAFEAYKQVIPEALAILDTGEGGFQSDRSLIRQVAAIAKENGQGILAYSQGLNAVEQIAERQEVPSATVFRKFDGDGQSITTMKRYLNRAAFKAAQEGHVVMVGQTKGDTIRALVEWVLDDRSQAVSLAPVSSILMQQ